VTAGTRPSRNSSVAPSPSAILAAAAGSGAVAEALGAAGVDVIVAYHSSVLRLRGIASVAGLLPWASANELTLGVIPEIVDASPVPVVATVCANDALLPTEEVVGRLVNMGVAAVLNAPTVGLLTGPVRAAIERAGLGFRREVQLMSAARSAGLQAWGYAFGPQQTRALILAGANAIVVHLGITDKHADPTKAATTLRSCASAARATDDACAILAHGGPLADPHTLIHVGANARRDGPVGFLGASVFDHPNAGTATEVGRWRAATNQR
jgi:predicted TIM-barrel enzyme